MGLVVSIWKYVKVGGTWRYKAAVMDRGVPVANMVLVDGRSEYHAEGTYYLRVKKQWLRAGNTPQDVIDASLKLAEGKPQEAKPKTLREEMDEFMNAYSVGKSTKTVYAMKQVLDRFAELCDSPVRQITKEDVQRYWQWEVDHSPTHSLRTAHNRVTSLGAFLKENGVDIIGRSKNASGDYRWSIPPFVEETVEVYTDEEIDKIMAGCDARHRAAYSTLLMGLLREKEAVYLTWDRIDVKQSVIHVKAQPQYDWKPKKHHERSVKVPRELMNLINALPRSCQLVFPTDSCKPDMKLLRSLKRIAEEVGLDPAHCWLHKFRASGATRYFQKGMPLPDIMRLGGWRDVDSVRRYMGVMLDDRLTVAVEAAWA
jgi:integrase/recombinase XerD